MTKAKTKRATSSTTASRNHQSTMRGVPTQPPMRKRKPGAGGTKLQTLTAMLKGKGGSTIEAMSKSTGWQLHSVRGAMSGALTKRLKLKIISKKVGGVRTYRIVG